MLKEHAICTHVELGTSCLLTGSAKLANEPCVMVVPYREQTISILLCTREVVVSLKNASTQKCAIERRQKWNYATAISILQSELTMAESFQNEWS